MNELREQVLALIDAHVCEPHTVITKIERRYGPPRIDPERLARALETAGVSSDIFNAESDAVAIAAVYNAIEEMEE